MNGYGDLVIQLHDIARKVEKEVGVGKLSEEIRALADRLHSYGKPMSIEDHNNVQDAFR